MIDKVDIFNTETQNTKTHAKTTLCSNKFFYYNIYNLFSCIAFHPNGHLIATAQTSGKSSLAIQQQSHVQVHLTIMYIDFPKPKLRVF